MANLPEGDAKRAKRGQGEGSLTPLEDGRYRWRVMVTTQAGEKRHLSGTARNLTEARQAIRAAREDARRNNLAPRQKVTVEQLVTEYIEHRTPQIKGRTVRNYQAILRRNILPSLGALEAQQITVKRLRVYYTDLLAGGQGDSVRRQVHNLIHASYKLGLSNERVTVNPAAQASPVYTEGGRAGRPKSFSPEDAATFYRAARADRWGWPLAFMLATGMRPGETLGLMWNEVTFNTDGSATVPIERTRSVDGGKIYEDTPKTERGRRQIRVTGDAVTLLHEVKAQTEREREARLVHNGHPYQVTGYVFTTRAGTPYRPDNLRRPMRRLCVAANIPLLTPHKLRHTWTSVLAAQGSTIEVLSRQLGHANATVTRNFYREVFEEERAALMFDPVTPSAKKILPPSAAQEPTVQGEVKESEAPEAGKSRHQA